jgi:hypothetical protein
MAQGFCTFVRAASGEMGFEFLKFERHSEYDDMLKRRAYRLEEFAAEADNLKALANDGVLLFRDIHDAFRWTG